ncbi:MAG: BON domain-containing protein [Chloroflexota bacterium]
MTTPFVSDEKLRAAILSRFAADERTAYANLRVGVLNGIAHLAGVVNSIETRLLAAELAQSTPGVLAVVNRIEAPGAPSPARTIHLDIKDKRK